MSIDISKREIDIDLSKLIDFSITFNPLQFALQEIVQRLKALEDQNEEQADELTRLKDELDELRNQQQSEKEGTNSLAEDGNTEEPGLEGRDGDTAGQEDVKPEGGRPCTASQHDALWKEIDLLKSLLGELAVNTEKDRHTIDELYAARKRRDSFMSPSHLESPTIISDPLWDDKQKDRPGSSARGHGGVSVESRPASAFLSNRMNSASMSMGDKVLRKAHEELPELKRGLQSSAAERTSIPDTRPEPGEDMQPSHQWAQSKAVDVPLASAEEAKERLSSGGLSNLETLPDILFNNLTQPRVQSPSTSAVAHDNKSFQSASHDVRPSITVSEQLKRDSHDIAYLNRVVAEILAEMKGLHDDVDLLQTTYQGKMSVDEFSDGPHGADITLGPGQSLSDDFLRNFKRRMEAMQKDDQRRNESLQNQLDELQKGMKVAQRMQDSDIDHARGVPGLKNRLGELENRLSALEKAADSTNEKLNGVLNFAKESEGSGEGSGERSGEGSGERSGGVSGEGSGGVSGEGSGEGSDGVNRVQIGFLQGAVRGLEKQLAELQGRGPGKDWGDDFAQLEAVLRRLQEQVAALESGAQRNARECVRLEKVKADRDGDVAEMMENLQAQSAALEGLSRRMKAVENNKAEASDLASLRDKLNEQLRLLELDAFQDKRGERGTVSPNAEDSERILRLQQELADQITHSGAGAAATQEDLEALRELVDRLDRCKADATLVANKAERDYVENALERLMREVEQVLNATNAGLIDTLDKSLGILRDMIDSKASKQDVTRLQESVGEGGGVGQGAADVLTGFKGYRCLGCNRVVENLRPRTLGAKMNPFLNRTPQHLPKDGVTRSIEHEQEQRERADGGGGRLGNNSAPPRPSPLSNNEYGEAARAPGGESNKAIPRIGAPSSR